VVKGLREQQLLTVQSTSEYRNPVGHLSSRGYGLTLNAAQQSVVDTVMEDRRNGEFLTYLLKGVTGSGKTEVYMEIIAQVIAEGKQAIVLIPEIALTYQTVMRFYNRFGDRVSILNSRLSAGERYDQYLRAKNGDIDIMIGPRSALFSPFAKLGLIIMDEEHENSYKSETAPRYHARETAVQRAKMCGASVILGSATPSVESYYQAELGNYRLLTLAERVESRPLPECEIIDLRAELKNGNRSILSVRLQELMEEKLKQHEQIMLFINRRGVSGFVSCRECGHVIKCPHCDVSLSQHNTGRMVCHYCGYEEPAPSVCPACGSKYISGFKAGTQKIEQIVQARFPGARTLRMDFDTTRTKDSYEKILQAFGNHEADILIGTQMIVKGHDFADVTLVGILAADMSLHVSDYHASERTFQLLTQAAGRAGRGNRPGQVVIQTYDPDHFAIQTARQQDYEAFYEQEKMYREMLHYPPVWNMLVILCSSPDEQELAVSAETLGHTLAGLTGLPKGTDAFARADGLAVSAPGSCGSRGQEALVQMIGPADASVSKINDIYRKVIYLKTSDYDKLIAVKDEVEHLAASDAAYKNITIQFDFNPMSGF
jgi:primosomal protein N' (replication factor Y)